MDRNTIIGFVLIGVVLFAFTWLSKPTPEQLEAQRRYTDSIEQVQKVHEAQLQKNEQQSDTLLEALTDSIAVNPDSARQMQLVRDFGTFAKLAQGENENIHLKNQLVDLTLSTKGGRISNAQLNKYQTYDSLPLILFNEQENRYGFLFKANGRVINTGDLYFKPIAGKDGRSLTMRLDFGNDRYFDLVYTLPEDSYLIKMDIRQKGMDQILPGNTADLNVYWDQTLRRQEKGRMFEERNSGIYYKYVGSDVEYLSESKDDNKNINGIGIKWIGYKNQFFSSVLISDSKFNGATLTSIIDNAGENLKKFRTETVIGYDPTLANPPGFSLFLGPNSYPLLSSYDNGVPDEQALDLDKLVPLGYKFFRWINTGLIIPMFTFFGKFFGNYGVIILLMTIVIKICLAPLTYKSYMSGARMRVLRPQIEEINAKFPGQDKAMDRQRATMDLYGKAGINPMSGCLPMLLQMPILLAMFAFFPSSIELRQESFLWAKDLSSYDAIFSWNANIPLISTYFGNHISLFCLLMTATNIIYTKINMDNTGGGQQMPGMKMMMYLMPVMFLFIFNNYASGLSYYYFVSTLITIIQTYVFRKCINEEKVLAKLKENQKKPRKKSGFMARLEEAQRQQQAALKQQQKGKGRK